MAWMVIVRDSGLYPHVARFPQPFQSRPMPRVNPLLLAIKLAPRFLPAPSCFLFCRLRLFIVIFPVLSS